MTELEQAALIAVVAEQALDPSPRRPVSSADGAFVYVACAGRTGAAGASDGALCVFDAATGKLAAKIATGPGTKAITQDTDPSLVWAVATGSKPAEGTVLAVRGAQVESKIAVPVGYGNVYPVPWGKSVLVMGSRAVVEIGTDPIEKIRTWALDFEPAYVTFDSARSRAWVAAGYGPITRPSISCGERSWSRRRRAAPARPARTRRSRARSSLR